MTNHAVTPVTQKTQLFSIAFNFFGFSNKKENSRTEYVVRAGINTDNLKFIKRLLRSDLGRRMSSNSFGTHFRQCLARNAHIDKLIRVHCLSAK